MASTPRLSRYLNLFTDFAFKWIFGREQNKDILIDFLNSVLEGEQQIVDLEFQNCERLGLEHEDRRVVFDLLCENDRGEKILVELQQARQSWFKERALYYASTLIQEQGLRGAWDYALQPTYVIAVLGFAVDDAPELVRRVALREQESKESWTPALQMVFLEIPKFKKRLAECVSHFERWLFLFGHMHRLERLPAELQEKIFLRLFETAEIGRFPEAERVRYVTSLAEEGKMEEALKYAKMVAAQEGRAEGLAEGLAEGIAVGNQEGRFQLIATMLQNGADWGIISKFTGIDESGFLRLRESRPLRTEP